MLYLVYWMVLTLCLMKMMIVLRVCRFGKQGCWQFNALLTSSVWESGGTASVISHQARGIGRQGKWFEETFENAQWRKVVVISHKGEEGGGQGKVKFKKLHLKKISQFQVKKHPLHELWHGRVTPYLLSLSHPDNCSIASSLYHKMSLWHNTIILKSVEILDTTL